MANKLKFPRYNNKSKHSSSSSSSSALDTSTLLMQGKMDALAEQSDRLGSGEMKFESVLIELNRELEAMVESVGTSGKFAPLSSPDSEAFIQSLIHDIEEETRLGAAGQDTTALHQRVVDGIRRAQKDKHYKRCEKTSPDLCEKFQDALDMSPYHPSSNKKVEELKDILKKIEDGECDISDKETLKEIEEVYEDILDERAALKQRLHNLSAGPSQEGPQGIFEIATALRDKGNKRTGREDTKEEKKIHAVKRES
jgi:hypothetical protein